MIGLRRTADVLDGALEGRVFSAVSAEIGRSTGPIWTHAAGTLTFDGDAPRVDAATIFDLASLTKVIATTTIALRQWAQGLAHVDEPVHTFVSEWTGADRATVTLRDLLEHSSGLPGYRDYFRRLEGRAAYAGAIAAEPLDYPPRQRAIYSDLGFMTLGFGLERRLGQPLDRQFDAWRDAVGVVEPLAYLPPAHWKPRIASTEQDPWRGRMLSGEVHDENAAALGGVAAHAGLFGTAAAVGAAARWWMALIDGHDDRATGIPASLAQRFIQRSEVPGSTRALGWDTMTPTSSCGTRMSARAFGHTGFTGTSLWIDPSPGLYFVLLTNRVHPTRSNEGIRAIRRAFHDAAVSELIDVAHTS